MSAFNEICITDTTDHFPIFTINYANEKKYLCTTPKEDILYYKKY